MTLFGINHIGEKETLLANFIQTGGTNVNQKQIVILSNNASSPWVQQTSVVMEKLGQVSVLADCGLDMLEERDEPYDLFLLDASGLQMELAAYVAWLHGRFPQTPIVVLTSSPTWRRARAVLQAGASDYMRRSMSDEQLLQRCRSLLNWPP